MAGDEALEDYDRQQGRHGDRWALWSRVETCPRSTLFGGNGEREHAARIMTDRDS
jgi:hypothetical protein